jgi:hypothetical protein
MEHMTSALIFPETEPSVPGMAKLLLFFDALSYYLPTESDGTGSRANNFFTNLCTAYAPAPLGSDLSRFSRLLREMETSRTDELARLFSAANTAFATGQVRDQDETSAGNLYSALQKDTGMQINNLNKERLWQARLILKLAEMLDKKEAEVRLGLAQVSAVEQKVFASLEGSGDAEMDALTELYGHNKAQQPGTDEILPAQYSLETSGLLIPLRVKAWAELYLADPSSSYPLMLVTANPESGAILLDGYENVWRRDADKLFSLSIPAVNPADMGNAGDQYLSARNAFREAARENIKYFAGFLQETAFVAGSAPLAREDSGLAENVSAWEAKVTGHFPGTETGFKKLAFYCFPNISCAELFQRLFHLEAPVPANKPNPPAALLAILSA